MNNQLPSGPNPYGVPDQRELAKLAWTTPEYHTVVPVVQGDDTVPTLMRVVVGLSEVRKMLRSGYESHGQGARRGVRTSELLTAREDEHKRLREGILDPFRNSSLVPFTVAVAPYMTALVKAQVGKEIDAVLLVRKVVGYAIACLLGIDPATFDADQVAKLSRLGMATQGPAGELFDGQAMKQAGSDAIRRIFGAVLGGSVAEKSVGETLQQPLFGQTFGSELAGNHVASILIAGFHTLEGALLRTLEAFALFPSQFTKLLGNPGLDRLAIPELLRWTSPLQIVCRDLVVPSGENPEGERVVCCLRAANHDPRQWERADELIVDRPREVNVALGLRPHHCLGANPTVLMLGWLIDALREAGVGSIEVGDIEQDVEVVVAQAPLSQIVRFVAA